jgi:hypothetical protein
LAASQLYFDGAIRDKQPIVVSLPIGEIPRLGTPRSIRQGLRMYPIPAGVSICSYSDSCAVATWTPITGVTVESARPCAEVATARNRTLEVSESGTLAVFDLLTGMVTQRAVRDSVGYLMPYVRQEPLSGTEFCRDLGWWYGVLVCDGWLRPSMIGYAKNDPAKRQEFERITRELFGHDFSFHEYFDDGSSPDKYAESAKIHLFSRTLRDTVHDCYCSRGPGRGALYKKIPDAILASGCRDCLLGVLAGLLEGDRTLGWGNSKKTPQAVCRSNTSSWCLVKSIARLGRLLGIRISITTNPPRNTSNESYSINWCLLDIVSVVPELHFVGEDSRQWQQEFLQSPPTKDDTNIVPIATRLAEHLGHLLLQQKELNLYNTCRQAMRTFYMTRRAATRILQLTDRDAELQPLRMAFERIVTCEAIHWDRVTGVSATNRQQTFGLVVPGTGVFMVQNGLQVPAEETVNARSARG